MMVKRRYFRPYGNLGFQIAFDLVSERTLAGQTRVWWSSLQGFGHISSSTAQPMHAWRRSKEEKEEESYDSQRSIPLGILTFSSTAFHQGNHICRIRSPEATASMCPGCFRIVRTLPCFPQLLIFLESF